MQRRPLRVRLVKWTSPPCMVVALVLCALAIADGDGVLALVLASACAGSLVNRLRPDAGIWPRTPPNDSLVRQIVRKRRARRHD